MWRGFKNKSDVCYALSEQLFMLDGRPHIAKSMLKQSLVWQWCSGDRNLLDRERDLVKISRRDRDFIKNSETETW